jgi:hypothetical protein
MCVLMHVPLHRVSWGSVQTQPPLAQLWPAPQCCPQPPQLLASVWVLTQTPLQNCSPEGQAQLPPLQLWPEGQACPQLPQLAGSVWVLIQVPLQRVSWASVQTQWPPAQL